MHAYIIPADQTLAKGAVALAHGMVSIDTPELARHAAFHVRAFADRAYVAKSVRKSGEVVERDAVQGADAQAWAWLRTALKSSPCEVGRLLRAGADGDPYARMVSRNAGNAARTLLRSGRTIGYRLPDGSIACIGETLATASEVKRIASKPADATRATMPYRRAIAGELAPVAA